MPSGDYCPRENRGRVKVIIWLEYEIVVEWLGKSFQVPFITTFTNQSTFAISFGAAIAPPKRRRNERMPTYKHYFIEQTKDGHYAIRAAGSIRASFVFRTQREAFQYAAKLNPSDPSDVEREVN